LRRVGGLHRRQHGVTAIAGQRADVDQQGVSHGGELRGLIRIEHHGGRGVERQQDISGDVLYHVVGHAVHQRLALNEAGENGREVRIGKALRLADHHNSQPASKKANAVRHLTSLRWHYPDQVIRVFLSLHAEGHPES